MNEYELYEKLKDIFNDLCDIYGVSPRDRTLYLCRIVEALGI